MKMILYLLVALLLLLALQTNAESLEDWSTNNCDVQLKPGNKLLGKEIDRSKQKSIQVFREEVELNPLDYYHPGELLTIHLSNNHHNSATINEKSDTNNEKDKESMNEILFSVVNAYFGEGMCNDKRKFISGSTNHRIIVRMPHSLKAKGNVTISALWTSSTDNRNSVSLSYPFLLITMKDLYADKHWPTKMLVDRLHGRDPVSQTMYAARKRLRGSNINSSLPGVNPNESITTNTQEIIQSRDSTRSTYSMYSMIIAVFVLFVLVLLIFFRVSGGGDITKYN